MARVNCALPLVLVCAAPLLVSISGCGISKEIAREKKEDATPVSKGGADLPGRKIAEQKVLDCTFYAVAGYDQAQDEAIVGERLLRKKQLEAAGQQLKVASKLAGLTLDRIDQDKAAGMWRSGLSYQTRRDGLIGEASLISRLTDIRDGSLKQWKDRVWPVVLQKLQKEFGATTPEQLGALELMGRPKQVFAKKKERCWLFETDREEVTTCWNRPGNLVRRTVRENPNPPAQASGQVAVATCTVPDTPEPTAAPPAPVQKGPSEVTAQPAQPAQAAPVAVKQAKKPKIKLPEKERLRLRILADYVASNLAAGLCEEHSCMTKGWTIDTVLGPVQVRCTGGDCLKNGWTAALPEGGPTEIKCEAGGCLKEGWTATKADRSQTFATCTFDNCWKDGWTLTHPDNTQSHTSCNYADCNKQGWTTLLANGNSVICRCVSRNCREEGAECN